MQGYVVHEDERFIVLEELLEHAGDCMRHSLRYLENLDYIVLGMKGPDEHLRYQENHQTRRLASHFFSGLKKSCVLYTFIENPFVREMAELYDLTYHVFSKDETIICGNADLTTEAVIAWLIENRHHQLKGSSVTIFGYGHLAKSLVSYLNKLEIDIHIVCRNRLYDKEISLFGKAYDFDDDYPVTEIYINTVPARILDHQRLKKLNSSAVLLDISSFPYGFDLEEAHLLGINTQILSGLPGKYAYKDAAKLLFDMMMEGRNV